MGLNLSTHQIATELDLNKDDAQQMTSQLRSVIVEKKPEVILEGEGGSVADLQPDEVVKQVVP
jgi:hypothetical protein